jgi:MFS family permease
MAGLTSILPGAGAFVHRGYRLFWLARMFSTFAALVISVAVGWQVYDITRDPFDLGLVGLIQFAPSLLLVLITGALSDRFNRRMIISICQIAEGIAAFVLLVLTWTGTVSVGHIFALLVVFGIARAFLNPAAQSLVPNVVPPQDLSSAIAWNSSAWQLASILGPVAGGLLYGVSAEAAYGAAFVLFVAAGVAVALIP